MFKITIDSGSAGMINAWFRETGGIDVWDSVNLSNPGAKWYTPHGEGRPTWQAGSTPAYCILDKNEIGVTTYQEVKRFHVAIRRGSQGLSFKLTDASSERLRKAVDKAGDGAIFGFDYSTQEAVIKIPGAVISLAETLTA